MTDNPIEKYCIEQGYKLAHMVNEKMAIVIKPRPTWCPKWLYKKIINQSVEIINIQ